MSEVAPNAILETPRSAAGHDGIPDDLPLSATLMAAQLLVADYLAAYEVTVERQEKMKRVVAHLEAEFGHITNHDPRGLIATLANRSRADQVGFLVEVFYLEPFSPYTIKFREFRRKKALRLLAGLMQTDPDLVDGIASVSKDAISAHRGGLVKAGLIGLGAAAVLGAGGWLAAPVLGTALGAAAGLSGAAATAHGLALLGGGALAAGGAGMAGGMWLVAGTGAALGAIGGAGGAGLYRLGAASARAELIKLQVTFKLGLLAGEVDMVKAQAVLQEMATEMDVVRLALDEERLLNDENTRRVVDLEQTLEALEAAVGWMNEMAAHESTG